MSYKALTSINGGEQLKTESVNYSISRNTDPSGRPSSDPQRPIISITVEATEKSDILETLLNSKYKDIHGKVTFNQASVEGKMIELSFEKAFIIHHEVKFNATDQTSMMINFVVSAEKIKYGNAEYDGMWPGSAQK